MLYFYTQIFWCKSVYSYFMYISKDPKLHMYVYGGIRIICVNFMRVKINNYCAYCLGKDRYLVSEKCVSIYFCMC